MPKSKNIEKNLIIEKARKYASTQKKKQAAFDGFLSGVNFILDELDGKTVVMDQTARSGDFIVAGTVTGCFSWAMRGVVYAKPKNEVDNGR